MARNGSGWRGPQLVRNQAPPIFGAGNVPAPAPFQVAPPAGWRGPQLVRNQAPPTSGAGNVPAPAPFQVAPPAGWRGPQLVRNQAPPIFGAGNVPAPVPVQVAPPADSPAWPQAGQLVPNSVRMYEDLPNLLNVDIGEPWPLPPTMFDALDPVEMLRLGNESVRPPMLSQAEAAAPALDAGEFQGAPGAETALNREWRKSLGELRRRISEITCILGYVDQMPLPHERLARIKDRVEMFFNITKIARDVSKPFCTATCDQEVRLMGTAEEQLLILNQRYDVTQAQYVLPLMKYVCAVMLKFLEHILLHHYDALAFVTYPTLRQLYTVFELLRGFVRQFEL